MKKIILNLSVDDSSGELSVSSDYSPLNYEGDIQTPKNERILESFIDKLVPVLIDEYSRGMDLSRIVKALTIADICADLQPYENVEHLWCSMMFSFLPKNEKKYRRVKEKKGFHIKVHEPVSSTAADLIQIPKYNS